MLRRAPPVALGIKFATVGVTAGRCPVPKLLTLAVAAFFFGCAVTILAQSPSGSALQVTPPDEPWALALSVKDFKVEKNGSQPDGRVYLLATNNKTNVTLSVTLEKVEGDASLSDCRETQKERVEQPADYKRENVETRESNGMVILEYTIPEFQGAPVHQRNLFACIPKGDIYVDIHFSKILYKPEDEKLLSDLLNSAQFISKPPKNAP